MTQLVIVGKRYNSSEWGTLSRLSDQNYLHRNGKMTLATLLKHAEIAQTRWLAALGYMFEDVRVRTVEGDAPPNVNFYPSGETRFMSKMMKFRAEQKARRKK